MPSAAAIPSSWLRPGEKGRRPTESGGLIVADSILLHSTGSRGQAGNGARGATAAPNPGVGQQLHDSAPAIDDRDTGLQILKC